MSAAFTLIELLVVVAIIGLLISLLAPSLRRAQESAQSAVCLNNLRSMGSFMIMFTMDHDDYFPHEVWTNARDGWTGGEPAPGLRDYYQGQENVLRCPTLDRRFPSTGNYVRNYTLNEFCISAPVPRFAAGPPTFSSVVTPSSMSSFFDGMTRHDLDPGSTGLPYWYFSHHTNQTKIQSPANLFDHPHGNNGHNVVFLDGHTRTVPGHFFDGLADDAPFWRGGY